MSFYVIASVYVFCMFFSAYVALAPQFRTSSANRNWFIFVTNMLAAAFNAGVLVLHIFKTGNIT